MSADLSRVIGYDEYVRDFEDIVLNEYQYRAEELFTDAMELYSEDENIEVILDGELCKDSQDKIFKFSVEPEQGGTGSIVYMGVY